MWVFLNDFFLQNLHGKPLSVYTDNTRNDVALQYRPTKNKSFLNIIIMHNLACKSTKFKIWAKKILMLVQFTMGTFKRFSAVVLSGFNPTLPHQLVKAVSNWYNPHSRKTSRELGKVNLLGCGSWGQ
jgi:hypothetical protein